MLPLPEDAKKLIPQIYNELLSPSVKEIGDILLSTIKTGRWLFAPIDYASAYHDRFKRHLERISSKVESENLIEGQAAIVVPALNQLILEQENSVFADMFINLLSNSIDKTKQDLAHPSFSNIISSLSKDEAIILLILKSNPVYEVTQVSNKNINVKNKQEPKLQTDFPFNKLDFPHLFEAYMDHLSSLGLAVYEMYGIIHIGGRWGSKDDNPEKNYREGRVRLTDFGSFFNKACIPARFQNS